MTLWNFLKGEVIVGHNVNFDVNFLYDDFQRTFGLQFQNDFIDTLRPARTLLPDIKNKATLDTDYQYSVITLIFLLSQIKLLKTK